MLWRRNKKEGDNGSEQQIEDEAAGLFVPHEARRPLPEPCSDC